MTTISPEYGYNVTVAIGDGATPTEAFAHPANINTTRGISFTTEVETDELIDIADQSLPANVSRRVRAFDSKIDGAGMVHTSDLLAWAEWAQSGDIKNIKFIVGELTVTGPYVLTSFTVTGGRMDAMEFSCTLEQASKPTISETD